MELYLDKKVFIWMWVNVAYFTSVYCKRNIIKHPRKELNSRVPENYSLTNISEKKWKTNFSHHFSRVLSSIRRELRKFVIENTHLNTIRAINSWILSHVVRNTQYIMKFVEQYSVRRNDILPRLQIFLHFVILLIVVQLKF